MRHLPPTANENVLVGYASSDDAGVYRLRDDLAIVQTVDFFTPIVDDPFDFGRIAAANALSDIYAMGATPICALNIVAFPSDLLDALVLERILEGGASIARQAGVAILGGHTIKDSEPKYGMAVTGTVDPRLVVTNANARPGDFLLLTKPLGTGVLATALKRGAVAPSLMDSAVASMSTLNDHAARAMLDHHAHAATDVTGFGLLGHAFELARASRVCLIIDSAAVPLFDRVLELIAQDFVPGGTEENNAANAAFTTYGDSVSQALRIALADAQTSGGLLISASPNDARAIVSTLQREGIKAHIIGRVEPGEGISVL